MLLRRTPPVDPTTAARVAVLLQGTSGWVPPPVAGAPMAAARGRGRHALGAPLPDGAGEEGSYGAADEGPYGAGEEGSYAASPVAPHGADPGGGPPADEGVAQVSADWPVAPALPHLSVRRAGSRRADEPPSLPDEPAESSAPASRAPSALDRWRTGRIDPGRRGVAALALVAVLAALLAALVVLRGRPQPVAPPPVVASGVAVPAAPGAASGPGAAAVPEQAAGEVVVSVAGKVRKPGLVRLPTGSRVADAVEAAGGARRTSSLGLLNLARRLVDGEQVLVGVPTAPQSAAGPAAAPGGAVDLNTATLAQLDALTGIGPVLAQRILDWRTENGRFASVDQLREVSGIGESTFAELKSEVTV